MCLLVCLWVGVWISDESLHVEDSTLRAAAAAPLCSVYDTETHFFLQITSPLLTFLLFTLLPSLLLYISIFHPFFSSTVFSILLSSCLPPLHHRWLHFYATVVFLFFYPVSISLSLNPPPPPFLPHPSCLPVLSVLFESISHHLSVTIFVSSITLYCSSHSCSHFHSPLCPPLLHLSNFFPRFVALHKAVLSRQLSR